MAVGCRQLSSPHVYDSASNSRFRLKFVLKMLISIGLENVAGCRMTNLMSRGWVRGVYVYVRSATRGISKYLG